MKGSRKSLCKAVSGMRAVAQYGACLSPGCHFLVLEHACEKCSFHVAEQMLHFGATCAVSSLLCPLEELRPCDPLSGWFTLKTS